MSRRLDRETILQCLFQAHLGEVPVQEAIEHVLEEKSKENLDKDFINRIVHGTYKNRESIDKIIDTYSIGWKLDRMPNVDLNVLRMAVYELLFEREVPERVVINEAIELVKVFSTPESGKFVNGILGKMIHDLDSLRSQFTE